MRTLTAADALRTIASLRTILGDEGPELADVVERLLERAHVLRGNGTMDRIVVALGWGEDVDVGLRVPDLLARMRANGWQTSSDDPRHTIQVTLGRMRREGLVIHDPPLWRLRL